MPTAISTVCGRRNCKNTFVRRRAHGKRSGQRGAEKREALSDFYAGKGAISRSRFYIQAFACGKMVCRKRDVCEMESVESCKLEIFIPETHLEALQEVLRAVDAGHIGQYDSCLSYSRVISCWRPREGSAPYLGRAGEISVEPELKVEVTCLRAQVDETVRAVKRIHPYEEPVINVLPLWRTSF